MNQETDRASAPTAHTITPHLVVGGAAQAADWYQQAFGAQVGSRIPVPGGKFLQIEVRVGDSVVMLADEFPDMSVLSPLTLGGTYGALDIATEDAEALWDRAVAAGARVYQPLQDMFWGDRHGQVIDRFGHRWGISQHLRVEIVAGGRHYLNEERPAAHRALSAGHGRVLPLRMMDHDAVREFGFCPSAACAQAAPCSRSDCATVVSPSCAATAASSHPVTATSSGMTRPAAWAARTTPTACWSLIAAIASGGSADARRVAAMGSASAASLRAQTAMTTSRHAMPAPSAACR